LSSSKRDAIAVDGRQELTGDKLDEFLSAISEAPDFRTAATFLVAQFADAVGARRAFALTLTVPPETMAVSAAVGFGEDDFPRTQLSIHDHEHPVIVSALSLHPMSCADGGPVTGVPFDEWVAIPFPQPQFRHAPKLLPDARVNRFASASCKLHINSSTERRRRVGLAPAGVVIVEASLDEATIIQLFHAAALAGPVLSRMAAVEEFRVSTDRLDQQRDLLTAIVNSLPDPIVIINEGGKIVVQNRRAEHLLAFTDSDSEGRRRAVEINNLLFTSHLSKAAIGAGTPETSGSRELNMVDPDEGTDLLFEVLTHELTAAEGAHAGSTVSVLRDVTDLRRAAGELERQVQRVRLAEIDAKRERDRLNLILENVADPILVTDDRSNIILMNKQAEQLFETPEEGETWLRGDAIRANDTKFTTFISDFTISPARARREQMSLLIPESNIELPVEVVSGKIMNRRGEPLAIVSVLHDLTEQVENERLYEELKKFSSELEARIRDATADLAEQNTRLQWQSRELEKANRLKSEFLASMSHELRTPINALIGYTALMLDRIYGELTPRQEDGLNRIQASAQHLLALINDILDLAKIEAGRMPLHLEDVSLNEVMTEISQQMEPLIKKKSAVGFTVDAPRENVIMYTDRMKVKQILLNLLSNAVKFTHSGGIWLTARKLDDMVQLEVRDTGIGINETDLDAIWEDFRQVDQSRTREFGGTGLGLSITRKLVDALGGEVGTKSVYGRGSTFSILLPMRSQPKIDVAVRPAPPLAAEVDS
jgi:PAS domain S-box-containing protein